MDVGYITTPDVSMTFTDDQLSVTVTEDELPSQLKMSSKASVEGCPSETGDTVRPSSVSTSSASCSAANGSTRFKVGPTSVDQSLIYHQLPKGADYGMDGDDDAMVPTTVDRVSVDDSSEMIADSPDLSCSKQTKKVSFPEGEALIKGFAHAPNPWYNVSFCTTENLVSAYVNSCNAHSVRPLSKLISQLKCVSDFGERINLLTLKGENLNCRHIETLEEIFRRVQFNTVDMSSTHLDDESAIAMFEMVEYYESVVHLKISNNRNLGLRAWMAAARMLRRTQHLESIDLRGCSINEQCMAVLGRSIKLGACIHALFLQECNLSGRGVLIVSAALRSISTIKELHIGDNNLQPSDGIQLGNLIRNNVYLHTLDVRNNHLQDIGIAHICDGLAAQPNGIGLKSLNISNNHFSPASVNVIAIALSRTKTLNTLNVSYNNLTNEGFFVLKEGLLKNKSLCRLSLRATKISDEGAVALAEYIADSYTISQLDLRDNDIRTAGLLAVSMCLKVQETITRLEIDQHVKKETAVKDYAAQQRFFLDELQSKVTQNAELQRAKLEKLLVQSKSEKTGAVVSPKLTSPSADTKPAGFEEKTSEQLPKLDTNTLLPLPSAIGEADSSCYFDPLGAVSVEDGADPEGGDPNPSMENGYAEIEQSNIELATQVGAVDTSILTQLEETQQQTPSVIEEFSVDSNLMEVSDSTAGECEANSAVDDLSVPVSNASQAPPVVPGDDNTLLPAASDRSLVDDRVAACDNTESSHINDNVSSSLDLSPELMDASLPTTDNVIESYGALMDYNINTTSPADKAPVGTCQSELHILDNVLFDVQNQEIVSANTAPADITSVDIAPEDLEPADITSADIVPADITAADIVPADMISADIVPADIVPADIAPEDVEPADITSADIAPVDIAPEDLEPADIAPVDIAPEDLEPADITAADIVPADITATDIAPADITAVDIVPADMISADIVPADIVPADIAPEDVEPADITSADIAPVDIAPEDLEPADIAPVDIAPEDMDPAGVVSADKASTGIAPADIYQSDAPHPDDVTPVHIEKSPADTCQSAVNAIHTVIPDSAGDCADKAPADNCQSLISPSTTNSMAKDLIDETSDESPSSTLTKGIVYDAAEEG